MRRALLTGATGFIGTALVRRLVRDGWAVHALARPSSDVSALTALEGVIIHTHDGSVATLRSAIDAAQPDIAFHLASLFLADHREDQVEDLVESNILFPTLLAEALAACGCRRLINTGTGWQHFHGPDYLPVNLYAATKQAYEDILLYYHDARDLSVITLKLFDTYGPGDPRRKLIRILIDAALASEPLDMSPGEQIVDLTYIDDIIDGYLVAGEQLLNAEAKVFESYFLSGERYTVRELVQLISQALGRPIHACFGGRPYREREVMAPLPVADAQVLPSWRPKHTLFKQVQRVTGM